MCAVEVSTLSVTAAFVCSGFTGPKSRDLRPGLVDVEACSRISSYRSATSVNLPSTSEGS
ncbi:hypothetical protein BBta_3443 [Bradyrhizobium sp. BTAi1]|nr:hypothetical protein BBta_3443 [Bradyrhizobium sp. BTAi1]